VPSLSLIAILRPVSAEPSRQPAEAAQSYRSVVASDASSVVTRASKS
jgi:hypothetical protein